MKFSSSGAVRYKSCADCERRSPAFRNRQRSWRTPKRRSAISSVSTVPSNARPSILKTKRWRRSKIDKGSVFRRSAFLDPPVELRSRSETSESQHGYSFAPENAEGSRHRGHRFLYSLDGHVLAVSKFRTGGSAGAWGVARNRRGNRRPWSTSGSAG